MTVLLAATALTCCPASSLPAAYWGRKTPSLHQTEALNYKVLLPSLRQDAQRTEEEKAEHRLVLFDKNIRKSAEVLVRKGSQEGCEDVSLA